jgi:Secretion system C-terminal sorting domain
VVGNQPHDQDIWPEDGWELIVKNFGTPTLGTQQGYGVESPYFVLYNKYTGKLKIFVALHNVMSTNAASIKINFDNLGLKRDLFAHSDFAAMPLQEFKPLNEFNTPNNISQKDFYWLVSETQTSYDPCNCTNTSKQPTGASYINVDAFTINESDINATITGTIDQQINAASGGVTKTSEKFAIDKASSAILSSYQSYSKFGTQVNNYADLLDIEKQNDLANKWLQEKQKTDPTFGSTWTCSQQLTSYQTENNIDGTLMNALNLNPQTIDLLRKGASVLPYLGAAIGIIDYLSKLGDETTTETKQAPPITMLANLKLQGKISDKISQKSFNFLNPGSLTSISSQNLLPFYNNTLGVFNILKSPKFRYYDIKPHWHFFIKKENDVFSLAQEKDLNTLPDDKLCDWMKVWKNKTKSVMARQYKMDELVKYIVNPSANLDVSNIEACLVFDYQKEDFGIKDPSNNPNIISNALYLNDMSIIEQTPMIPFYNGMTNPNLTLSERIKAIEETGLEFETVNAQFPANEKSFVRFRTKYLPLSCLHNINFTLIGGKPPRVYIKLIVRLEQNQNDKIRPTQLITYDISEGFKDAHLDESKSGKIHMGVTFVTNNDFWSNQQFIQSGEYIQMLDCNNLAKNITNLDFNGINTLTTAITNPYNDNSGPIVYNNLMGNLAWFGDVTIPSLTIVPANTHIETTGKIIIGDGTLIKDGCLLRSAKLITTEVLPNSSNTSNIPTVISPNAILEINSGALINAWGFCDINNDLNRASNDEIMAICKSKEYIKRIESNRIAQISDNIVLNENSFNIYPNPATNNVTINYNTINNEHIKVTISDITGKILKIIETDIVKGNNGLDINIEELASGSYLVSIITSQGVVKNQKLVKF